MPAYFFDKTLAFLGRPHISILPHGLCVTGLFAGAGDVGVLDLFGALDWVTGQVMCVPGYGLAGDFGVLAEKFQRVLGGGGVVFLVGEFLGLY